MIHCSHRIRQLGKGIAYAISLPNERRQEDKLAWLLWLRNRVVQVLVILIRSLLVAGRQGRACDG